MQQYLSSFSNEELTTFLSTHYSLSGNLHYLYGELDYNFRLDTNDNTYLIKVSRDDSSSEETSFQVDLINHLATNNSLTTKVFSNTNNEKILRFKKKQTHLVRVYNWIDGRLWSSVNPITSSLRKSLGKEAAKVRKALSGFDHKYAHRTFDWDTSQGLWTKEYLQLFSSTQKEYITYFQQLFERQISDFKTLRKAVIHNDINDNNIIVSEDLLAPKINGVIDFGDAIYTQVINELAICCTYAIMHTENPLAACLDVVKGYHKNDPLQEKELKFLYACIGMRLVISLTKAAINKQENPENEYLLVSEQPAWELIKKWKAINPEFAHYAFRKACDFDAHPKLGLFKNWVADKTFSLADLFPTIGRTETHHLDLSVGSPFIGTLQDMNNLDLFQFKIDQLQRTVPNKLLVGGYCEPRMLYTSTAYDRKANEGSESRTVHIGLDVWLPAYTFVHALFDGEVVTACDDHGDKEYGGLVILKHTFNELTFYTLYGHNTVKSAIKHSIGDHIKKGEKIAELGGYPENGNWAPHLHFQIMLSMLDYKVDFPGVTYKSELAIWKDLCPNPDLLFKQNLPDNELKFNEEVITSFRKKHLGKSLSLQYNEPLHVVRGSGVYLIDTFGKKYLDTVNNVAHVGHEHPKVVKAGQQQMALLNTNTRYLHKNINQLAETLLAKLPPELNVIHFVNSGSEANELAIRMAKAYTNEKDIIASEVGYHGNTNMCVDISSYKFDGKGGKGAPEHTQIFPIPDTFRGRYGGKDAATKYAKEVQNCIETIQKKGRNVAAFIIEPIISCGGQIELPESFLKEAYKHIRKVGGICISDEIQTGCGRMGSTFWGFQLHDVVPDIVTIGKPLGNGHPVAAVACRQEIADAFANGMEFFNTFGGNPVSCAIANEVLQTVKNEKLQENAHNVGTYLKEQLKKLALKFPIIGDVRGQGLFLGFEIVNSEKEPLPEQTDYLVNRMKAHGILMSSDGPDYNVIKIKPPMVFSKENADLLINTLHKIFNEDFMKH